MFLLDTKHVDVYTGMGAEVEWVAISQVGSVFRLLVGSQVDLLSLSLC